MALYAITSFIREWNQKIHEQFLRYLEINSIIRTSPDVDLSFFLFLSILIYFHPFSLDNEKLENTKQQSGCKTLFVLFVFLSLTFHLFEPFFSFSSLFIFFCILSSIQKRIKQQLGGLKMERRIDWLLTLGHGK